MNFIMSRITIPGIFIKAISDHKINSQMRALVRVYIILRNGIPEIDLKGCNFF